jgi:tRNA-binding protein
MEQVTWEDFRRVDMRVGRVLRVEPFPKARRPAYKIWIDFGEIGIRQSSAQITHHYSVEDLVGRLVVAVVNFPPRQIVDFQSEVLILGAMVGEGEVVLLHPEREVAPGVRIA